VTTCTTLKARHSLRGVEPSNFDGGWHLILSFYRRLPHRRAVDSIPLELLAKRATLPLEAKVKNPVDDTCGWAAAFRGAGVSQQACTPMREVVYSFRTVSATLICSRTISKLFSRCCRSRSAFDRSVPKMKTVECEGVPLSSCVVS